LIAATLDFEVPLGQIITEITAEILFVAVPKIGLSNLINIWLGGAGNINELPVGKVGKKVPIGLPPLLCFVGCLGWHLAEMGRAELCLCCGVILVSKNDNYTVSKTNAGAKRCTN
jgi:hypothetical protein